MKNLFLLFLTACAGALLAQTSVTTWHYNNARTSVNMTESILSPANVNSHTFGKLFVEPVDGFVVGHPLYLPALNLPGQGTHNVVYVATMHDTVYAFDADTPNAPPLWTTSILNNSPAGATTVPASVKKVDPDTGWNEVGIISTPVIDTASGTIFVVAETYENGNVVHRLHALDIYNGLEKLGGPVTIIAAYTLNGVTTAFTDLYQMNRPGLLLQSGHVYIAFGSNCCNNYSQGWVMSYNSSTLQQEGVFNAEPGRILASIWQKGAGISSDPNGYIYAETGEGPYLPGTNLSTSVLKLNQSGTSLSLADWFTPYNHLYLSNHDLDMAEGVVILPDQSSGSFPHEMIAVGKQGTVYVLNRDSLGHLCATCTTTDTQIIQELPQAVGSETGTPVYWNNMVYFTGVAKPVMAFKLSNGLLVTPPAMQSASMSGGGHALITANGNNNGILWMINSLRLWAMNAHTLATIYTSSQAANGRDTLPPLAHFATPIAVDGKVFVGTQNSLIVYGLFRDISVTNGNNQAATVATILPTPLQVQAYDPYSQTGIPGVTVTFSDGGKGGTFNPATAITNSTGIAATKYTLPTKSGTYTLTASAPGYASGLFTETALPGAPFSLVIVKGNNQTAPMNTVLPIALATKVRDIYHNGVPGVYVTYSDNNAGGAFSANPVASDSSGVASVNYTTPGSSMTVKIRASSPGLSSITFTEYVQ